MITAWMGQGQDDKAIATCRLLSRCRDPKLRQQAKPVSYTHLRAHETEADLDLRGPDRLALTWDVRSTQQRPLPWQEQFERDLQREVPGLKIEQTGPGRQQISSRVASSHELAQQMAAVVAVAGRAAGSHSRHRRSS